MRSILFQSACAVTIAILVLWAGLSLPGCSSDELPPAVLEQIEQEQSRSRVARGESVADEPTEASPSDWGEAVVHLNRLSLRNPIFRPVEQWSLQETAEHALGRIGEPAVPYLVAKLRFTDPDPDRQAEIRTRAAEVLAQIGPAAEAAVPDLIESLRDESPRVRKSAAFALGQIGPDASAAVPELVQIMLEPAANSAQGTALRGEPAAGSGLEAMPRGSR